jgi:hypothetical protein
MLIVRLLQYHRFSHKFLTNPQTLSDRQVYAHLLYKTSFGYVVVIVWTLIKCTK